MAMRVKGELHAARPEQRAFQAGAASGVSRPTHQKEVSASTQKGTSRRLWR